MTWQACGLCEGSGVVPVERTIPDPKAPRSERRVLYAYRCPCPAGNKAPRSLRAYQPGVTVKHAGGRVS